MVVGILADTGTQISLPRARNLAASGRILNISGNPLSIDEVEVGVAFKDVLQSGLVGQPPFQEERRGVTFYIWGEDLRGDLDIKFGLPAFDAQGRGGRIAVQDQYVFRTIETQAMRKLIDTSVGERRSLAEEEEFSLLAKVMTELRAYSLYLSDQTLDVYVEGDPRSLMLDDYAGPEQWKELGERLGGQTFFCIPTWHLPRE